jgi:hypothetical protein
MKHSQFNAPKKLAISFLMVSALSSGASFADTLYFGDGGNLVSYNTGSGNLNFSAASSLQDVFAVGSDGSLFGTDAGSTRLLKASTTNGSLIASYVPSGSVSAFAQSGSQVFMASGSNVYGLQVGSLQLNWQNSLSGSATTLKTGGAGVLYAGGTDGKVSTLNAVTGSFNAIYSTPVSSAISAFSVGKSGQFYAGNQNGNFYSVNASTGATNFSYAANSAINQIAANSTSVFFVDGSNRLNSLDAKTGALQFSYAANGALTQLVLGSGSQIFAAGTDGFIYSFDTKGSLLQTFKTESAVKQLTVGNDGNLYALSGNKIHELNGSNLGLIQTFATASEVSSFALAPVPEPETYAMLLAGLGLMACVVRRRKAQLRA